MSSETGVWLARRSCSIEKILRWFSEFYRLASQLCRDNLKSPTHPALTPIIYRQCTTYYLYTHILHICTECTYLHINNFSSRTEFRAG